MEMMFPYMRTKFDKTNVETKVYVAYYALKMRRFREASRIMAYVIQSGRRLTLDERDLFTLAYRNWAEECAAACRKVEMLRKEEPCGPEDALTIVYESAEYELYSISEELHNLVGTHLMARSTEDEKAFYYKLLGDYCRYTATVAQNADREALVRRSIGMYERSLGCSELLPSFHPHRLGAFLNYAMLYYNVYRDIPKALSIAEGGLIKAKSEREKPLPRFCMSVNYMDMDYVIGLTEANIEHWRVVQQELESKSAASAAAAETEETVGTEPEKDIEIERSQSFSAAPGSSPKFEKFLEPRKQGIASKKEPATPEESPERMEQSENSGTESPPI